MMATSVNGADLSNDIDIDALIMPDVNESEVSAVVDSLHQELSAGSSVASIQQHSQVNQTNSNKTDLTKTIKTEGESSDKNKTTTSAQLTLNLSSSTTLSDSSRRQSLSLMSPFSGITPQTPLTPNSQIITSDEQAAIHKQAGLLAIHTYCSKHGQAKAKEILDGVTKVKNFLTNLIQLAAKSGPQVHSSVHALVQKLVGGAINEDEFAKKIEEVLKSKHQPGLLPFLKTSVSDLRQHILLQKGIMKQLVEKKVAEKRLQQDSQQSPSSHQSTPSSNQATPPSNQSVQHIDKPMAALSHSTSVTTSTPSSSSLQSTTTSSSNITVPTLTLANLTAQQQQLLKHHLSNLPEHQQKLYLEQIKKQFEKQRKAQIQMLLQQKQQLSNKQSSNSTTTQQQQQQQQQLSVLLKQQELVRQQQQQATLSLGNQLAHASPKKGGAGSSQVRKPFASLLGKKLDKEDGQSPGKGKTQDNEEEDEEGMDIAGVNLKEETAHFLPNVPEAVSRSVSDQTFIDTASLRDRIIVTAQLYGISDVSDDAVSYLSHAMEERLKNVMEKITVVNQHRTENLKDDGHYQVTSDVRGQFKVLSKIDQISASRRDEKEKEMIFKAAKSRSKQDDPELAKKKEQAKQIQLAQEREIHQKAANETALAAIGRRKRTATAAFGDSPNSNSFVSDTEQSSSSSPSNKSSAAVAAVFSSHSSPSRTKQKRKLQAKDVIFVMEQEKETKKSLLLYKSLLN